MALKRSKKYEAELNKISGMRMTMETQMGTIEDASFNFEAMNALRTGAQALKTIHGELYVFLLLKSDVLENELTVPPWHVQKYRQG